MCARLQRAQSGGAVKQHSADMADSLGGVQALWAHIHAILDAMAPEYAEGIIELGKTVLGRGIPAICQKAVSLQQPCWTDKPVRIPPERGATG